MDNTGLDALTKRMKYDAMRAKQSQFNSQELHSGKGMVLVPVGLLPNKLNNFQRIYWLSKKSDRCMYDNLLKNRKLLEFQEREVVEVVDTYKEMVLVPVSLLPNKLNNFQRISWRSKKSDRYMYDNLLKNRKLLEFQEREVVEVVDK